MNLFQGGKNENNKIRSWEPWLAPFIEPALGLVLEDIVGSLEFQGSPGLLLHRETVSRKTNKIELF